MRGAYEEILDFIAAIVWEIKIDILTERYAEAKLKIELLEPLIELLNESDRQQ